MFTAVTPPVPLVAFVPLLVFAYVGVVSAITLLVKAFVRGSGPVKR